MNIQYGCQTYTWKMNVAKFQGRMPHIIRALSNAGFQGLEAEICMLDTYFDHPEQLHALLEENGVSLAALVLHQDWAHPQQTAAEAELTKKAIAYLRHFPFAKLMVSHHAGQIERGEGDVLRLRRENLIACLSQVADQAAEQGIITCFHPNSSANSLFRTPQDYALLFELLSRTEIGYAPDIGHLVNGGLDPIETLRQCRNKIRHVHFKDRTADGQWAVMGEGAIDYPAIVTYLKQSGYSGWIIVEDESPKAETDSDGVALSDGIYMKQFWQKEGANHVD